MVTTMIMELYYNEQKITTFVVKKSSTIADIKWILRPIVMATNCTMKMFNANSEIKEFSTYKYDNDPDIKLPTKGKIMMTSFTCPKIPDGTKIEFIASVINAKIVPKYNR